MYKKSLSLITVAIILCSCSGPQKRNKWQKENDFSEKRAIYYNEFVAGGGMIQDDIGTPVNPFKKQVQDSFLKGAVINE